MYEINTLLICLHGLMDGSTQRQLQIISEAMLTMSGRVTMLGMSRWTEKGGSYRTLQRFFNKPIPWASLNWAIAKKFLTKNGVILAGGDATTVTKSGKETFGLGKFFSSIYSRAVPGIAFQSLSLIDVVQRKSWPVLMEQIHPKEKKQATQSKEKKVSKHGRGRPKGSKNKNRKDVVLNAEMTQVQWMLRQLLTLIEGTLTVVYFVYDGAYGNNMAVQMTRQVGLHLISKLRHNSALYFIWNGEYSGKGRPRIYGEKVDYQNLPSEHRKDERTEGDIHTSIYQFSARHKKFSGSLNIVIILKKHQNGQAGSCHFILNRP